MSGESSELIQALRSADDVMSQIDELMGHRRSCDNCDLCCTAVTVWDLPEGPKIEGVRCQHLCGEPGRSCSIYETRPKSCREYFCMWRHALIIPEEMKPVDCGFVLTIHDQEDGPLIVCAQRDPTRRDAPNQPRYRKFFFALARALNALVVIGEGNDAEFIFSPRGRMFSKKNFPEFFTNQTVGLPVSEFLGPKLPMQEQIKRMNLMGTLPLDKAA